MSASTITSPRVSIRPCVRRAALAVTLVAVALALLPGSAAAAPQRTAPADPNATPAIVWRDCGTSLQCARVRVPLSWDRPREGTVALAVMRRLAGRPGRRIGSVFFNPGGPGSSGIDALRENGALLDGAARGRFDIVSWDPRGVGASTRVRCFANGRDRAAFWGELAVPSTRDGSRRYARRAAASARRCGERSGALLRHISTAETIRDLDHLRRLLGAGRLNYIGWSYGTFLGQTYANRWPRRVRAMVLDAVVDAAVYVRGREASLENIVRPSDEVFDRFQSLCESVGPERCALAGRGPVAARVSALLEGLRRAPIPAPGASPPGVLTYGEALTAIFPLLRGPGSWPDLAEGLARAADGDGSALATVARASSPATGSDPPAVAIGCADSPAREPLRAWPRVIRRLGGIAGPVLGWWLWAPCAAWPAESAERYTGPWDATTPNPVLVIGTRFDPNTSYANARRTARRLGNAVLLTHGGYGHISFGDPSRCVVRAIGAYLVGLKTPARGTVCPADRLPFDPRFGEPLP
jgi:pimeloyl-ACP methyl ester carboxylesterase